MTNMIIRLVLLAFLAGTAFSLMCHVCQSTDPVTGQLCLDPFDKLSNTFLQNCSERNVTTQFCRKIDQTVKGERRVFRTCAWEEHPRHDCYFNTAEYFKYESCICRADNCNSGPKMAAHGPLATLITSILCAIITTKLISGH